MYFGDLYRGLLEHLRLRVVNGEFSERRLARIVGASQPHIHNVLKGGKILSNELCDRILNRLGISVLDLIDSTILEMWVRDHRATQTEYCYVRVLDGLLGPGQGWPMQALASRRFPINSAELARMGYPVAARLGDDPRMRAVFSAGDWVILDQSNERRKDFDSESYYLLKLRGEAVIRRLSRVGESIYMVSGDSVHNPAAWERLEGTPGNLARLVRARVRFLLPESDWWDTGSPS